MCVKKKAQVKEIFIRKGKKKQNSRKRRREGREELMGGIKAKYKEKVKKI